MCIFSESLDQQTQLELKVEEEPFDYIVEEHVENDASDTDDGEGAPYIPTKRARIGDIETEEVKLIFNCEQCPKTFGEFIHLFIVPGF